ncbi:hypothetical protein Tco_1192476 [Tanacetum coccineum]
MGCCGSFKWLLDINIGEEEPLIVRGDESPVTFETIVQEPCNCIDQMTLDNEVEILSDMRVTKSVVERKQDIPDKGLVANSEGNMIHCSAEATVTHNFLRLKEGSIYSVKNFAVKPNKEEYRILKNDAYMLESDGSTTIRKALVKADGFVRYPFELQDFDDIESSYSKLVSFADIPLTPYGCVFRQSIFLYNKKGQSIRVTLLNKIYLSSTSSTVIYDDDAILAIKALKKANRYQLEVDILPSKGIEDSVGSNNPDDYPDNQPQKLKRIVRDPSIITPSKPVEEIKNPRMDVEDSESEDNSDSANSPMKKGAVEPSAKKRKNCCNSGRVGVKGTNATHEKGKGYTHIPFCLDD